MFKTHILANVEIASVVGAPQPPEHNADTQVDCPNISWDMTKCLLKLYSCKLKKQQCSRRSATCWAQRFDSQVDWANSFWDMTKCLKRYSANWRNNSVVGAAQPAEHNALTLMSIDPIVSEIWQNVWNLILANWRTNRVVGAVQPSDHNVLTLRSIGPFVFEIWQNA